MSGCDATSRGEPTAVPRQVGTFEILSVIGHGGMGIVYRARDLKLGREVALKCPLPRLATQADFRERFMREARTASKLLHPHITTVFEVFEDGGVPWLAMELIDGPSLRSLLADGNPLPLEQILEYAEGLTDGLRVAHAGQVLHRDVNPNNVLVGKDGRARLTDFGLACAFVEPVGDPRATTANVSESQSQRRAGTPGYMSPEQALGRPLDARSDLFSLGLVLYEMCTGRPAFVERDLGESLDALLHREPTPISSLNPEIPLELRRIVRKATAKHPFQRYQSAAEMLLDVRALRRKLESEDAGAPDSFARPAWRRYFWRILGAVAVAVGALGAWLAWRTVPDRGLPQGWAPHQLTSAPGWETEPALSPDGSLVAYTSDETGKPEVWLIDVHGGNPIRLTDDPAPDRHPAWFPDGSSLAFVSERGGEPAVWRVPRLGGSPVLLVPNADDPAVSPDGTRIAFTRRGSSGQLRIAAVSLSDLSHPTTLTGDRDGLWDHVHPTWSPDGRTICYADFRDLWLVSAAGGPARRLTSDHETDREPAWSGDGKWIYFSSMRGGTTALWRIPAAGGRPERLTLGTGPERQPSLSRDGSRLAYSTLIDATNVVVLDRLTGSRSTLPGRRVDASPDVAPDASAIVFASNREGKFDLWLQSLDDGRPMGVPTRLTDHPGSAARPVFSPDGRWIAYFRVLNRERDIWIVSRSGGLPLQFTDHPGIDIHPAFSPDGSRLAFVSDRGGRQNVWVAQILEGMRAGATARITNSTTADECPVWSPDGTRLAYLSGSEVWIANLDADRAPRQVTHGAQADAVRWDPPGEDLLVVGAWGTQMATLRRVSLRDGSAVPLEPPVVLGDARSGGSIGLSADGRFIAYVVRERKGDIWVSEASGRAP